MKTICLLFCLIGVVIVAGAQQPFVANMDESKVGEFTLPNPLQLPNGSIIHHKKDWEKHRAYWLAQFQQFMYGKMPSNKLKQTSQLISRTEIFGGKAIQYIWTITFAEKHTVTVLGVMPNKRGKVPVFLGLNFCGNQTTSTESSIPVSEKYVVCNEAPSFKNNVAQAASRGTWASLWQFEKVIAAGYGSITVACADFEEDLPSGYQNGIRTTLADQLELKAEEWSALGAWAWGLSRLVDFLETVPQVNAKKIIVHGHSRLGKAALWAAANDQRFAAVISNESGEGGAALSRRNYGENLWRITNSFPHWFLNSYKNFAYKENELPLDQHILLSLLAPRPLYVASAMGDQWSDPKGEFLSAQNTASVYQLYGKTGLESLAFPGLNSPIGKQVRYHIREGIHDMTAYDWEQYVKFVRELVQ
jgi:hypothetical protein